MPKVNVRALVTLAVVVVAVIVVTSQNDRVSDGRNGSNGGSSDMTAGDQQALDGFKSRIEGTSDCEELQIIFEASDGAHERFSEESVPNLSKMKMHTAIMGAANDRMSDVGCYD